MIVIKDMISRCSLKVPFYLKKLEYAVVSFGPFRVSEKPAYRCIVLKTIWTWSKWEIQPPYGIRVLKEEEKQEARVKVRKLSRTELDYKKNYQC